MWRKGTGKNGRELNEYIMTKIITVTSIRHGSGKTTVAAILAEKLAEKYTVCLIDNNKNNINIYSSESTIENINLYSCLSDKESCRIAIKESATKLKKNLYFFSGSNAILTEKEIQILKNQDIFEYIILDSGAEIDGHLSNFIITVVNPNITECKIANEKLIAAKEICKCMIIINRYEDSEFKANGHHFKLFFCPELISFANGYELHLPENNEIEIKKVLEKITGEKLELKTKGKFKLFGRS